MERKRIFLACFVGILILLVMADPALAAEEAAKGGYLAGYENSDPRPTSISWWSTIAYLVSLFAIFVFVNCEPLVKVSNTFLLVSNGVQVSNAFFC